MKKIFVFFLAGLIIGCNSVDNSGLSEQETTVSATDTIKPRPRLTIVENAELFRAIAGAPQQFTISTRSDTAISCSKGTVISFPRNCFVDKDGNVVSENIKVEIVEALGLSDFLRNDLQTLSGDDVLQSAGMIYIDATYNDQPLTLQKNSSLNVEMPTLSDQPGMRLFTGQHNEQGNINWTESTPLDEEMIPLPLSEFNYTYYTKYMFPHRTSHIQYMDSSMLHLSKKYEGTFIATHEFEERFGYLNLNYWHWWEEYKGSVGVNVDRVYGKIYKIECPLLNIYTENTDKPLWYADSIVYRELRDLEIRDSIEYYKHNKWNGTNQIWYGAVFFKYFINQRKERVKVFDPKGVDLSNPNAKDLLMKKGYSEEKAREQIMIHNTRQRLTQKRKEKKELAKNMNQMHGLIERAYTKTFKVTQLGWANVDRFLDDPNAKEVELFVQVKGDSIPLCDITLLFPEKNIAINGIETSGGKYRFTKEDKKYRKLPVGDRAFMVAMTCKNGEPYFAFTTITIKEKQTVNLEVKKSNWKEIEAMLARMN